MAVNLQNITLKMSAGYPDQLIRDGLPQVAFSGRSNVGKSSLLNTILGRKTLARVSGTPGKTVTANYYLVDRSFYLVDLPGYGFARRSDEEKQKWSDLMEAYFHENEALRLVVQLIDLKVGPTPDDDTMLQWFFDTRTPYLVAATKADKLNATELKRRHRELSEDQMIVEGIPVIAFSSLNGTGKEEVLRAVLRAVT
ncbi:MAG: YihA family ribosome biogenesis GTP-binding protein [Clostridia bacterium]|nr:YihA family ribosome biogenesis GTP-binding protein [Clostridia bacterium]